MADKFCIKKNLLLFCLIIIAISVILYIGSNLNKNKVSSQTQARQFTSSTPKSTKIEDCQIRISEYNNFDEPFKKENEKKWLPYYNCPDFTIIKNPNNEHPIIHLSHSCNVYFQFVELDITTNFATFNNSYQQENIRNSQYKINGKSIFRIQNTNNQVYYYLRYNIELNQWQVYEGAFAPKNCNSITPTNPLKYNQMFSFFQNSCKNRAIYNPNTFPILSNLNDSKNNKYIFYSQCSGYNSSFLCWQSEKYQNNTCSELPLVLPSAEETSYNCLTASFDKKTLIKASCP